MSGICIPDYCFSSYRDLTIDFIRTNSIHAILFDIDNTLIPYEEDGPTEELYSWFQTLRDHDVKVAFISNNNKRRVEKFNEKLGYVAYSSSMKPFKRNIKKALCALGVNRENAIFMGDQIWTDVLGAHCAGLPVVLVPPIRDKQDIFTKLKRFFEKPFLRKFRKEHPDSYECEIWTRWKL